MSDTLSDLWISAEFAGELNPPLVDWYIEAGDYDYGEFLEWAWKANRWPVGGTAIQFRWGSIDNRPMLIPWYRAGIPFKFSSKMFHRNKDGKIGKRPMHDAGILHELFPTARAAFDFLYAGWQKMTDEDKAGLTGKDLVR